MALASGADFRVDLDQLIAMRTNLLALQTELTTGAAGTSASRSASTRT